MDNLKYYNDSFAYNYDIFMPAKKSAEIIDMPNAKRSVKAKAKQKVNLGDLDKYGREGVAALASATPVDSGLTVSVGRITSTWGSVATAGTSSSCSMVPTTMGVISTTCARIIISTVKSSFI